MAAGTDKIRVLIVDDIPETRENVRKLLAFETDVEVVGVAATGREAVQLARDLQPNIVMMDINMPDMDGITAVEMITRDVPIAQVIMMSVQSEADYLRRSMLAGARDFLTKPFTSEDLVSTIRRVHRMGQTRAATLAAAAPPVSSKPDEALRLRRPYRELQAPGRRRRCHEGQAGSHQVQFRAAGDPHPPVRHVHPEHGKRRGPAGPGGDPPPRRAGPLAQRRRPVPLAEQPE